MAELEPKKGRWARIGREQVLLTLGIAIIISEFINGEVLGRTFHYEFLFAGLALCGVGIAQWGDRK